MHNVDAAALIIVRILDEQKITVFVRQVQVIGIEGSDFFFMNQKLALIPMVEVFGRIKNESLCAAGSAVENVYAVDQADLRIADAFCQIARLFDRPGFSVIVADGVIHFALIGFVIGINVKRVFLVENECAIASFVVATANKKLFAKMPFVP